MGFRRQRRFFKVQDNVMEDFLVGFIKNYGAFLFGLICGIFGSYETMKLADKYEVVIFKLIRKDKEGK